MLCLLHETGCSRPQHRKAGSADGVHKLRYTDPTLAGNGALQKQPQCAEEVHTPI